MAHIFLPVENTLEASVIPDISVIGIQNLQEIVSYLSGVTAIPPGTIYSNSSQNESLHI